MRVQFFLISSEVEMQNNINAFLARDIVVKHIFQTTGHAGHPLISVWYEDKLIDLLSDRERLLRSPVAVLELGTRFEIVCQRSNIQTVAQLCALTERMFDKYRGTGRGMMEATRRKLLSLGLSWGMEIPSHIFESKP